MKLLRILLLFGLSGTLIACDNQGKADTYKTVEGVIQVSMMPSRGPDGARQFGSQVELITDDAILLLVIDRDTRFIDSERPDGELELGHIYRVNTKKLDVPKGTTFRVSVDVDMILRATKLEYIGPAGPDAPSREKVRLARAYKNVPEVRKTAEQMDQLFRSIAGDTATYTSPAIAFTGKDKPVACATRDVQLGMFYCLETNTVVLDRDWIATIKSRAGVHTPYDVYEIEYFLAHLYAHHWQALSGLQMQNDPDVNLTPDQIKEVIAYELQADCLAGVALAHMKTKDTLEPGDATEAMAMAAEVAEDAYNSPNSRVTIPDTYMHGTQDLRADAILKGFQSRDFSSCLKN